MRCWRDVGPQHSLSWNQDGKVFAELLEAVKVASLGQITDALFEVGGQNWRSM